MTASGLYCRSAMARSCSRTRASACSGGAPLPFRLLGIRPLAGSGRDSGRGERRMAAPGNAGAFAGLQGTALSPRGWQALQLVRHQPLPRCLNRFHTDFDVATDVPPDFTGTQLSVPRPTNGVLYLRLRDDPMTVQTLALPVMPIVPAAGTPTAAKPQNSPVPGESQAAPQAPSIKTEP